MSTNVVDISGKIKEKLLTISALSAVYEYEIDKPVNGAYPFATITPSGFSGEFGDTQRNIRRYEFAIRLYQERTAVAFGNEKAERVVRELVDEILTLFDNDTTLNGMVKYVIPIRGDLSYEAREIGDTRLCEIILECMTVVDSIT